MADLQEDFDTTLRTLTRLADAFQQLSGDPDNSWTKQALQTRQMLQRWEQKFGIDELEKAARERGDRSGT